MRTRRAAILLALLVAVASAAGAGPSNARAPLAKSVSTAPTQAVAKVTFADWPTYHGSSYRGGNARTMPAVSGLPHVVQSLPLDGKVYAAPIVVKGVLIVATENNTVYAYNSALQQLWKRHLGTPSPASERPCGNIDPLGITGTPTYDPVHGSVYVAPEYSGSPPRHEIVSLSFTSGAIKWHKSLDLPGVDSRAMQQRGALITVGHRVWVPFGGLAGDCGAYKGRVIGVYRPDGSLPRSFTVPTTREAGIWTPPGPSADSAGNILVAVGNGESGVGDKYDFSDSILELNTAATMTDSFSPTTWPTDNDADLDLGSQGPTLIGPWVFTAGKSGTAYVLRRSHLGRIGGQVSKANICKSFGGTAANGDVVYVPCTDGLRAVRIDSAGKMHVLWHAAAGITGSPIIGGGRIWSLNPGAGMLYALNPSTGVSTASVNVGVTSRFATPAAYGPNLYIPTLAGATVVATS
jgi:outer membrane protein assembly factor BamB